jgi:pimeloyl-ACP methyl ester carboxylesterase
MFFDQRVNSARLGKELIRYLNQMWLPNAENAIFAWANEKLPGLISATSFPASGLSSAQIYLKWHAKSIILIQGALGEAQASRYLNSCRESANWIEGGGVNRFVREEATIVVQRAISLGLHDGLFLIIAGHSLGGTISLDVARQLRPSSVSGGMSVVSFGSPRPGPSTFSDRLGPVGVCRWMASNDPIPCLPPRTGQNVVYDFLLSAAERANEQRYVQPSGGVVIDENGNTSAQEVPTFASLDFTLNIAAWLTSLTFDLGSGHSTQSYLNRLTAAEAELPPLNPNPPTTHRPETTVNSSSVAAREEARRTAAEMRELFREGQTPTVRIPVPKAFTARPAGNVWVVLLRGEVFAIAPSRRRARRIANIGNQWLRKLQVLGAVDGVSLVAALENYLHDAQDPLGGFKPVMKT